MKVLKSGSPKKSWSLKTKCTGHGNGREGCGAKLELEKSDLRYFAEQEFPWRIQPAAVVFKCPECGVTTDIPKSTWPNRITDLKEWTSEWRDNKETV